MEFRLTNGRREFAVFEASDGTELAEALRTCGVERLASEHVHIHLRYSGAWWNLTSDLSQFGAWLVEAKQVPVDDVARFEAKPWQHPSLLWQAASQLKHLLDAATGSTSRPGTIQ